MKRKRGILSAVTSWLRKREADLQEDTVLLDQPLHNRITPNAISLHHARYQIGQVVRHRTFPFRGVIFDVDPQFANTDEWYQSIPEEVRPRKDQPYYHLFAENERTHYVAYVSEQNLLPDETDQPLTHPDIAKMFHMNAQGRYELKKGVAN